MAIKQYWRSNTGAVWTMGGSPVFRSRIASFLMIYMGLPPAFLFANTRFGSKC